MVDKNTSSVKVYEDNDRFFDVLWQHIDNSKDIICIGTYDMDHKNLAGITLQKLRNAARRGVKVFLIIEDLNFYANKDQIRLLEAEGALIVRNNPIKQFYMHLMAFKPSHFFCRNHQKVMLVDDNIFCGSLNIANMYSSTRYGDGSFRDLNIILKRHPSKKVRDFFKDIIERNSKFYPEKINMNKINEIFNEIDVKYENEYGEMYKQLKNKEAEVCVFIEESPPNKTEVSRAVLDIIKKAQKSIKIVQPYVQNVDELEDLLVEAIEKRGVHVEIVTARIRDQPVYRTFLNSELFNFVKDKPLATVYEEPYKFLHMKAVVVDDGKYITLGSFNQDIWSFYCNNEANILLVNQNPDPENPTLAYRTFMQVFNNLKRECRQVDFTERQSTMGLIENKFWRLFLSVSYLISRNR